MLRLFFVTGNDGYLLLSAAVIAAETREEALRIAEKNLLGDSFEVQAIETPIAAGVIAFGVD